MLLTLEGMILRLEKQRSHALDWSFPCVFLGKALCVLTPNYGNTPFPLPNITQLYSLTLYLFSLSNHLFFN